MPRMPEKRTLNVHGFDIPIREEAPGPGDVVACVRKEDLTNSEFDDNEEAPCMVCGKTVVFRPYMRVCEKVCVICLAEKPHALKN